MSDKIKPSLWWLAFAPVMFLIGAGGGTSLLVWQVLGLNAGQPFPVPSKQEFKIDEPGTYVLWHNYKITFNGTVYNKPESLPGQAEILLTHEGREVPMKSSWGVTTTSGNHEKKEIGRHEIDTSGEYTLMFRAFTQF